jgi:hypothetical protein
VEEPFLSAVQCNVMQTEIHTAEPRARVQSAFEFEMAIEKLKGHKSHSADQIPAELIKAGGSTIRLLLLFGIRRNSLRSGRSRSLCLSIKRATQHTVIIIEAYYFAS